MFDDLPRSAAWRHEGARRGFETVFIRRTRSGWRFAGHTAAVEDDTAWSVRYDIGVDERWRTRTARVWTWTEDGLSRWTIASDGSGRWEVNGVEVPLLTGCLDVDLESSACTNTFPVHRSRLEVGSTESAPAAYFRVGDGGVERLEQTYRCLQAGADGRTYDYEAPQFGFHCQLDYDRSGLVVNYPGIATRAF